MTRLSQRLCLTALAAGGLLATMAPASAETIYGGGSSAAFGLYRSWFDCYGAHLMIVPPDCTPASGHPIDSTALFAYAAVGSGAGITALNTQQSPNAWPSDTPYENASIVYSEGTTGYGTGPNFWDVSTSEAPLPASSPYPTAERGPPIQIPTAGTAVAIAVNTTGLNIARSTPNGGTSGLYLSRRAYCGIFTGQITNWNDPILTYDNNNTQLHANRQIRVVRDIRSSGMTFLLSRHLDQVCAGQNDGNNHPGIPAPVADWTGGVGTTVVWPATFITATGSAGVASTIAATPGTIGYAGPDYTQQVATPRISPAPVVANLQNQANWAARVGDATPTPGEHVPVAPSITNVGVTTNTFAGTTTMTAAAWGTAVDTPALRNPAGVSAYPIIGFSLLDLYTCYFPAAETTTLKGFVQWYTGHHPVVPATKANQIAVEHGFVPLNTTVKARVWAWVNSATAGVRTGPISGTCTISSGT